MNVLDAVKDIFHAGGFVMWPLLVCSLATWAIVAERLWSQRNYIPDGKTLVQHVNDLLSAGDLEKARNACERSDLPLAQAMMSIMRNSKPESSHFEENVNKLFSRARIELGQEYKRYLWVLGTIGSATPFLGLFGTVVGILRAFGEIGRTGDTGFAVVAAGISEALIATAAGIIVAVIAVAFFNFLQVRASRLSVETRLALELFVDTWQESARKQKALN